jgi:hypothetical protein
MDRSSLFIFHIILALEVSFPKMGSLAAFPVFPLFNTHACHRFSLLLLLSAVVALTTEALVTRCCLFFKTKQLSCTEELQFLNSLEGGRVTVYKSYQTRESLSRHYVLLFVYPEVKFMHISNHAEHHR